MALLTRAVYKLGYTRTNDKGDMPNSTVTRNQFSFAATYKIADRLTASASMKYYYDNALSAVFYRLRR